MASFAAKQNSEVDLTKFVVAGASKVSVHVLYMYTIVKYTVLCILYINHYHYSSKYIDYNGCCL